MVEAKLFRAKDSHSHGPSIDNITDGIESILKSIMKCKTACNLTRSVSILYVYTHIYIYEIGKKKGAYIVIGTIKNQYYICTEAIQ